MLGFVSRSVSRHRLRMSRMAGAALVAMLIPLTAPASADAQIRIGFCQGAPGLGVFSASFLVCCPESPVPVLIVATTPPVDCSSAAAVMGAMNAAIGGLMFGGAPVFGIPVPVASPVPGQSRFDYPLSPEFLASGCCIVGGSVDFPCGTMSLRINPPCDKTDDPGGGGRPTKLCIDAPPPPFPTELNVMFEGCPLISIPLDGTETPADVRAELLAALVAEGYVAFINEEAKLEVTGDCVGELPTGVDEFGLTGGPPMPLGILICPPPDEPSATSETSWGAVKGQWRN